MKDKLRPLPKWLRLTLLLALMGLLVFCMWLEAGRPALSPKGALVKAEQIGLLERGTFLTCEFVFPDVSNHINYFPAVSRTKTRLHTCEVKREGLLWQPNERALSVPLEDPVTALLLPWQVNIEENTTCYPAALVYCPEGAQVTATMTIGGKELPPKTFSGRTGKGDKGCFLVAFENLYYSTDNQLYLAVYQHLNFYYHRHIPMGAADITVELTIFDQNGAVFAQKTLQY